jgi:hypothetical protein
MSCSGSPFTTTKSATQDAVTFPDSVELKAAPLDAVMKVAGGAPQ